ncbi:MAG: cupin domain-containing protein, partial [Planctomycetaceae bacterium]|nr:cupin domain-containing protein [Planctomycetaceae bacterium]
LSEAIGPAVFAAQGLPLQEGLSVAQANLPPGVTSLIHVHPVVSQFTWVLEGELTVTMKDASSETPYTQTISASEGVQTNPGTFFQLQNQGKTTCQALYIVTPAFVFETDETGQVRYNDAIVLPWTWDELQQQGWNPADLSSPDEILELRAEALARMAQL